MSKQTVLFSLSQPKTPQCYNDKSGILKSVWVVVKARKFHQSISHLRDSARILRIWKHKQRKLSRGLQLFFRHFFNVWTRCLWNSWSTKNMRKMLVKKSDKHVFGQQWKFKNENSTTKIQKWKLKNENSKTKIQKRKFKNETPKAKLKKLSHKEFYQKMFRRWERLFSLFGLRVQNLILDARILPCLFLF